MDTLPHDVLWVVATFVGDHPSLRLVCNDMKILCDERSRTWRQMAEDYCRCTRVQCSTIGVLFRYTAIQSGRLPKSRWWWAGLRCGHTIKGAAPRRCKRGAIIAGRMGFCHQHETIYLARYNRWIQRASGHTRLL